MTDEDPQRLKSTGGTPVELTRALRALGRDDLDSARLARVAEQLAATVAATGTPTTGWLRTLTGTKLGLTGLLAGLGALGVLGYVLLSANRAAPNAELTAPAPAPAPAPVAANLPQEPAPAPGREPLTEVAVTPAPAPSEGQPHVAQPSVRSRARPRNERVRASDGSRVAAQVEPAPDNALEPSRLNAAEPGEANTAEPSQANTPEPARANTPEPLEAPAQTEVEPPAKAPLPPPQRSEAALLHEARKLASREPEAALRLLDEHARRFANGMLVPEREVLAIETLRRLGRDAEAERRLQRFEARYPKSLHLRRLERAPATADDL